MDRPSEHSGSLPQSLLERVRAKDGLAWERLTLLYTPLVLGWVRGYGVPRNDAPDVTQDVFLQVARSIGRFRREQPGDTFTGWLRTIAQRCAAQYARKRPGHAEAVGGSDAHRFLEQLHEPLPSEPISGETPVHAELLRRGLELVRGDVSTQTWTAFEQTTVHHRPAVDVATELGMTVGAVYVAKSRVLKRLREELDGLL